NVVNPSPTNPSDGLRKTSANEVLARNEIHALKDIFFSKELTVEVRVTPEKMMTKVIITHFDGIRDTAERHSEMRDYQEYQEKARGILGLNVLRAHRLMEKPPESLTAMNSVFSPHGILKLTLSKEDKYQHVANTCHDPICPQLGPSYEFQKDRLFICIGHHYCAHHEKVTVGYRPLLFSYIPESNAKLVRPVFIFIKNLINILGTVASNPLLKAEHEQKRSFVDLNEVHALDGAAAFLEASGFHKLMSVEGFEAYSPPRDSSMKANMQSHDALDALVIGASKMSMTSPAKDITSSVSVRSTHQEGEATPDGLKPVQPTLEPQPFPT
ncbi:hypothetical protein, partial [Sansalvadorimonas verongulae]|uniref:hypothetical protein n=1 Tax=Sansalvadorimonas verongulae TaxID=2172824 RepID=UPI0018AD2CC4